MIRREKEMGEDGLHQVTPKLDEIAVTTRYGGRERRNAQEVPMKGDNKCSGAGFALISRYRGLSRALLCLSACLPCLLSAAVSR
jgi:hypothetical protein